ncbi:MAG: D-aminoacyl-tRNA deacylase [Chloroflexi bacterium]|nr:D-aminoacyl-tRNA deacylase [Chloroflexota bacterium]MCL5951969.1 D-aminoacyl-tRNA deacylase [Chloroflexota bacterium]
MRVVIQRVQEASVTVEGEVVGAIGRGLVILVGVTHGDAEEDARFLAQKIATLRIFEDAAGKFNLSALDIGAEALVVSQFTLYADTRRGRRPDFIDAARPEAAEPLIERFVGLLREQGLTVATGQFRAKMLVRLVNDGPVTIIVDSP